MKKISKVSFVFALIASFSCLSAEEENKEIAMSKPREECPTPNECQGGRMEFDYYRHDAADADRDVYTQGKEGECKAGCGSKCGRKGAAKAAQE